MKELQYPPSLFGQAKRTAGPYGYVAYFPAPIPRSIDLSPATVKLLADAEAALGRLAGVGQLVPNPHLLIRPYLLREAISSTRIEGTQASMAQLFEFDALGGTPSADIEEVINYIDALEWGLNQLKDVPLGVRLIREMHRRVLAGVRGRERRPGEFRITQNWIGEPGSTIDTASFVPPPPDDLAGLIADWERYANEDVELPLLIQNALLHYQFETLHPFLDGNGRLGRLLIVFFLIARDRLPAPLLYLSSFFEQDRQRYYDALQAPRQSGDIEPWLQLFLRGVETQASDAVKRAERIAQLRERYRAAAASLSTSNGILLVDVICKSPILTTRLVQEQLNVSRPTAIALLRQMERLGVITEDEVGSRSQLRFVARELLNAVADDAKSAP